MPPYPNSRRQRLPWWCLPWWWSWFTPYLALLVVFGVIVIALLALGVPDVVALGVPTMLSAAAVRAITRIAALPRPAAAHPAALQPPAVRPPAPGPALGW
jgi:hypothetical protein